MLSKGIDISPDCARGGIRLLEPGAVLAIDDEIARCVGSIPGFLSVPSGPSVFSAPIDATGNPVASKRTTK